MLKRIFTITLLLIAVEGVRAQYDVSFAHYFDMQPSFNPGTVGKETKLNIQGAYAMDFAGFQHNPNTIYMAADMPMYFLKTYHGLGAQIVNDQIGLFTHQRFALQYAMKTKLLGGQLSIGVQAGMLNESFKGSKVDLEDSSDPAFSSSDINGNTLDLGVGIDYKHANWYVGAAVQHLNSPLVELGETNELQVDATYYFTGGYNIKLRNPFITIHPSFLVRYDGVDHREDLTCRVAYTHEQKKYFFGMGYAYDKSATIYLGANIKSFIVGYSFEMYPKGLQIGNGSHEIAVGYQMDIDIHKKGRNLHKSVRLL